MKMIRVMHHGRATYGLDELVKSYREHSLCYSCAKFHPGSKRNCAIAQSIYEFNRSMHVVTPIYMCELYTVAQPMSSIVWHRCPVCLEPRACFDCACSDEDKNEPCYDCEEDSE